MIADGISTHRELPGFGIDVRSYADPASTIADLRELTGLDAPGDGSH